MMLKTFALPEPAAFDFSIDGWSKFQDAVTIRNAVTHPKDATALRISENDDGQGEKVDCVATAAEWYGNEMGKLFDATLAAIRSIYIADAPGAASEESSPNSPHAP